MLHEKNNKNKGVTPFASILRSIRYKTERQLATGIAQLQLKKVEIYDFEI